MKGSILLRFKFCFYTAVFDRQNVAFNVLIQLHIEAVFPLLLISWEYRPWYTGPRCIDGGLFLA